MYIPYGGPAAWAAVRGGEGHPRLGGMVHFYPAEGGTIVTAEIYGLPERRTGFFAFHIHAGGSCSEPGAHFDPEGREHPLHAGDLPPLLSAGGRAWMAVLTDRFRPEDVIGRTVILHADADDFHTQPAGNPGERIACGEIRTKQDGGTVQNAQTVAYEG